MTLDEAIEHAEKRACGNDQCAKDHVQLADWLRELRRARMEIDLLKMSRDGFRADAQKYKAENAKLRERYYAYEYKMDGLVSRLTGGLLSKSAATPNDVLHSSVVEELTEDQIKENCKLEADNAKLREAVATAIKVQAVLCRDADSLYCRNKCQLHRPKSNDCLACDVIGVAQELGIEV